MTTDNATENKNTELPALEALRLLHGSHKEREQGVCLLEAVAWFAGEPHSDHPQCTDVALAAYGRSLNDRLKDDERQLLCPLIPKLIGTRGSRALAKRRAYLLVDRHVRVNLPAFFRELPNKPRPDLAAQFEALPPVVDAESARRARDLARECRDGLWQALSPSQKTAAAAYAAAAYAYAAYAADAAAAYGAAYAYAAAAAYAYAAAADAAYAYDAYADADAAAADAYADAYAAAADAYAAADAPAWRELRKRTIARAVESFEAAIALTDEKVA